jgi:hypothetical protein
MIVHHKRRRITQPGLAIKRVVMAQSKFAGKGNSAEPIVERRSGSFVCISVLCFLA